MSTAKDVGGNPAIREPEAPADEGRSGPVALHRRQGLRRLGVVAAISAACLQLAFDTPDDPLHWFLLAVGVVAAALTAMSLDWIALTGRLPGLPKIRRRWLVIPSVIVGLLVGWLFPGRALAFQLDRYLNGCPPSTQMTMLTSPESLAPARDLADTYMDATAEDDGCPTVNVYVYAVSDAVVSAAMPTGWQADDKTNHAPRPDAWLPDSSVLVNQVITDANSRGVPLPMDPAKPSIAVSPVVVAVPAAYSDRFGLPLTGSSWTSLVTAATANVPGRLVRPDPAVSTTGRLATTAAYAEYGDREAHEFESGLARAANAGQLPLSDSLDQLCELRQRAPRSDTALITSEQMMIAYNRGDPLGGRCPTSKQRPPGTSLVGYYPADTPVLDYPFVVFDWHEPNRPQTPSHQVATAFRAWTESGAAAGTLQNAGLRPPGPVALVSPLTDSYGVSPNAPYNTNKPTALMVAAATQRYAAARLTGRVVLALDISGSMAERVGDRRRLDVAIEGIRASLDEMGPDDEFGLVAFPTSDQNNDIRTLVPIGARDELVDGRPRRAVAEQQLAGLAPAGNTPLAPAIITAVDQASESTVDDEIRAVVVLTDGRDTSGRQVDEVLQQVRAKKVRVFVVAIGEASCSAALVAQVTGQTAGGCDQADFTTVKDRLTNLFDRLWKGQKQ